ncbi:MAG: hypothetical protein Kow00120_27520 [Anaerolineae bacterium]
MTSLWDPPAITPRPMMRAPLGPGATSVSGRFLQAAKETLESLVVDQVRTAHPAARDEDVRAAQAEAVAVWLRLLRESVGGGSALLEGDGLFGDGWRCSYQLTFLAYEYGQRLSRAPDFAARAMVRVLAQALEETAARMSVQQAYALLPWLLHPHMRTNLRVTPLAGRSAIVEWRADAEMAALPPEDRQPYLDMYREMFARLLQELPCLARRLPPAEVKDEGATPDGGPGFCWRVTWREPARLPAALIGGVVGSAALALLAAGVPALSFLSWVALLPVAAGVFVEWAARQRQARAAMASLLRDTSIEIASAPFPAADTTSAELQRQVDSLTLTHDFALSLGGTLDRPTLMARMLALLTEQLGFDRALLLLVDEQRDALVYGEASHVAPSPELQVRLENLQLPLDTDSGTQDDLPLIDAWKRGERTRVTLDGAHPAAGQLGWMLNRLEVAACLAAPLFAGDRLVGVVIVDNRFTGEPITDEDERLLAAVSTSMAMALENARLYSLTDEQLSARIAELRVQQQIDRELNASLQLDRVLTLTIDWALRFTNAAAGSIALYNADDDALRFVAGYGYGSDFEARRLAPVAPEAAGVTGRVVRTGQMQIVPDTAEDPDCVEMAPNVRSLVAVPVVLEHRVVGVLTLESTRTAAFRQEQIEFAERLADRAAVAIENTRLFDETRREREKLSTILGSTADGVIVVGIDGRLEMVNVAARSIFRLDPKMRYRGMLLADVFADTPFLALYNRAVEWGRSVIDEIELPDARTYHVRIAPVQNVGWVAVIQDVTHFKEMDRLKSELVTTVSHDLKNPLNVLGGYVELIEMRGVADEKMAHYLNMIRRSIVHMRQLIDDLLDMARIESGIDLEFDAVDIRHMFGEVIEAFQSVAAGKDITVSIEVANGVPPVRADRTRLRQVLANLLGNALKYTPREGAVRLVAEPRDEFVLVSVIDNGMGIAPEDQAKVFSRFYRVRRPETDGIEGTGLGLAIVKSLVELHGGEVSLESQLAEGTAFHITLPRADVAREAERQEA